MMVNWIILVICSILFGYMSIIVGRKLSIIDKPSPDKIHQAPIPRSGGLGIFLSFIFGIILFRESLNINIYEIIFLLIIFLIGFIDDFISIPQRVKFGLEIILAVILSILSKWKFIGIPILDIIFPTFYLVGSINALNEVDGMDGLAGGIALISCLFLSYWLKDLTLIVTIGCLGFLLWNFHPAKVFMGDGGSLFLGAFIGLMSLKVLSIKPSFSTLLALIFIYSAPIYDSALTVIRRFLHKKSIFSPDLGHFYNRLYNITQRYIRTVLIIYLFSATLGILGIFIYSSSVTLSFVISLFIWFLLFLLGYKLGFLDE